MAKRDQDKDERKKPAAESADPPWAKKATSPEPDDDDADDDEPPPPPKSKSGKAAAKAPPPEPDEDEDDDDDDDEPPPPPKSKRGAKADLPVRAADRGRGRPTARDIKKPVALPPDDGLPNWLPWAVMIGLISLGVLGAMGVFSKKPGAESAADAPAASAQAAEPTQIAAQHLLVQYKGSMRAAPAVERTKEQAKARAEEALKKAKGGGNFDALVGEYSDEPGAGERKGQLGKFSRQAMVKPFSDAAFKLKVGELSGLVETDFGYHVIKRTE